MSKVRSVEDMRREYSSLIAKGEDRKFFYGLSKTERNRLNARCAMLLTAIKYRESLPTITDERIADAMERLRERVARINEGYDEWKRFNTNVVLSHSNPLAVYHREMDYKKVSGQFNMFRFMCGEIDGVGAASLKKMA